MSRYVDTLDSLPLYAGRAEADRRGRVIDVTYAPVSAVHDFTAGDNIDITNDVISVTGTGELIAGTNITIAPSGSDFVISAQGGGGDIFLATYGTTTFNEIETAHNAGKTVFLYKQESFGTQGYMLPLAGVFRSNVPSAHYAYFQQSARYTGAGGSGYLTVNSVYIVDGNDSWSTNYVYPFIKPTSSDVNKVLTCVGDGIAAWQPSQGGGTTYTAGDHIDLTNDTISVTGITELVPGDNITITASGVSAIISASGGGVTYNAGSGIDITNDTISLDDPVNLVAGSNISITVSGASAVISSTGGGGTLPISGVDGYYTAEYDVDHATLEYNLPSVGGGEPEHLTNTILPGSITISESYNGDVTDSHVYIGPSYIEFKGDDNSYAYVDISNIDSWNDAIVASQIASAAVVSALPANPVSNVLYLIPEA